MVECWLPYGKTEVNVSIPLRNLLGVAEPEHEQSPANRDEIITESLLKPLGSRSLSEIVKPSDTIAIAIEGTVTPRLAATALASIVDQVVGAGASQENIVTIIGNGTRNRSEPDLLVTLKDNEHLRGIRLVEHTRDATDLEKVGITSRKTEVEVKGEFARADTRIAVGEVIIDAPSGFRGAHTSILPSITGLTTTEMNRRLSFTSKADFGVVEENPVLADTLEAVKLARVDISVNLVPDSHGRLLRAYSGELETSLKHAISDIGDSYMVKAPSNADIVIVSAGGRKFDFDLYHSANALRSVSQIVKKGSKIILLAECSEGLGAEGLRKLAHIDDLSEIRRRFMLGGEVVHLIKSTLRKNETTLVSALPDFLAEPLGFKIERTANDALSSVIKGSRRRQSLVVTYGCTSLMTPT